VVRGSGGFPIVNLDLVWGGQGLAREEEEKLPGTPGAANYRHILDRMNAIIDYLNKKKSVPYSKHLLTLRGFAHCP